MLLHQVGLGCARGFTCHMRGTCSTTRLLFFRVYRTMPPRTRSAGARSLPFGSLPNDLQGTVMSHLSPRNLARLSSVNRGSRNAVGRNQTAQRRLAVTRAAATARTTIRNDMARVILARLRSHAMQFKKFLSSHAQSQRNPGLLAEWLNAPIAGNQRIHSYLQYKSPRSTLLGRQVEGSAVWIRLVIDDYFEHTAVLGIAAKFEVSAIQMRYDLVRCHSGEGLHRGRQSVFCKAVRQALAEYNQDPIT